MMAPNLSTPPKPQLLVYIGIPFVLLLLPALPDQPFLLLLPLLLSIMPGSREIVLPAVRQAGRLLSRMWQNRDDHVEEERIVSMPRPTAHDAPANTPPRPTSVINNVAPVPEGALPGRVRGRVPRKEEPHHPSLNPQLLQEASVPPRLLPGRRLVRHASLDRVGIDLPAPPERRLLPPRGDVHDHRRRQ